MLEPANPFEWEHTYENKSSALLASELITVKLVKPGLTKLEEFTKHIAARSYVEAIKACGIKSDDELAETRKIIASDSVLMAIDVLAACHEAQEGSVS